ncbi:hypothetical protein [Sphingomonas baiyangensis]|uniref:Uncharacterized protein n=1 Tax=Sphingomonas baiyangensis TaxID=2572576 RepID=A0A4U1L2V4_9SPHN|nr:hypothetical protein [Sphingomonas baiyangensis]TKD51199.1 hypothetical protein FBR43_10855 [Sphingomonas baiyangensis]
MRRCWSALAAVAAFAGCSDQPATQGQGGAPGLERAAIERGLVRDPADRGLTGVYARDADRICIVETASEARIGALVDYGDDIACTGRGTVAREDGGTALAVAFGGGCSFTARFDGDRITFPATVPEACRALCSGRASFAALTGERLSDSASEAVAMRDTRGGTMCQTAG